MTETEEEQPGNWRERQEKGASVEAEGKNVFRGFGGEEHARTATGDTGETEKPWLDSGWGQPSVTWPLPGQHADGRGSERMFPPHT